MAAIMAVPIAAVIVMWGLTGLTLSDAIAGHSPNTQHGTVLIRIALAATIGLMAILIAAIVMGWFGRRLTRDVASMESAARRFADQQLPKLVERLRRGDQVELESELPAPPEARITEIGHAAAALASVQRTAVTAAITETSLRSGISQVFVSLALRSQSLLQRQLRLLDDLERKAADPAALADLFPLDHLTTRMRRHAEGLIILSGAVPGRAWSTPVPVIDVIRGAIAEVEDYKRIAVVTNSEDMVAGSAVADMIHLLAELIENAALFSPSGTRVEVRGELVGNGFAFEIEDRGLGIKPDELDAINQQLSSPTDFDLANADQQVPPEHWRTARREGDAEQAVDTHDRRQIGEPERKVLELTHRSVELRRVTESLELRGIFLGDIRGASGSAGRRARLQRCLRCRWIGRISACRAWTCRCIHLALPACCSIRAPKAAMREPCQGFTRPGALAGKSLPARAPPGSANSPHFSAAGQVRPVLSRALHHHK